MKDKILEVSLMLFFKYGIKSVTMDDIAKEMGVSKKTIYQFFKEKDDIVNKLCEMEMTRHQKDFNEIYGAAKDPIHEMTLIYQHLEKVFRAINPVFFHDLHKQYSQALNRFNTFKKEFMLSHIERNIKEGIKQKLYRNDLDLAFVAQYRLVQMDMLMMGNGFAIENISYTKAHQMVLDIFMHGISTVKGHKLINKYKNKQEED